MAKSSLARHSAVSPRTLRVLYVEDCRADADLCLRQLKEAGFEPMADVVASREEFSEKLGSTTYDIILSDHRLPGWSGMDALEMAQAGAKGIPFILVTGSLGEEDAVESIKQGATDYVLKDRPERLSMAVERAFKEKAVRDEAQRTARALWESEQRYRQLVELSPDGIFVNYDDRLVFINPSGLRILGATSPEQVVGRSVLDFVYPDYHDAARERIRRARDEKKQVDLLEEKFVRVDGTVVDVEVSAGPFAYGGEASVQVVFRDITKRKQAEEALRESEERYRIVAETATDAIITMDEASKILFANTATERIFGYTIAEMLGQELTMLMPESMRSRHRSALRRYAHMGERHMTSWSAVRLPGLHKNGKEISLEISFAEFVKNGRRTFTGVLRDITERKLLEEQLRQAQKMEGIGRLAGGVAHDFNNLLTIITGYSQLLLDHLRPGEARREQVEEIKGAADRAAALTRQLLAFSRQQILAPQVMDLNATVANMDKMLRRLIGEDIELQTSLGEGLGRVKADPGQVEQVIMNLAVNARDAVPQGGKLTLETANVELDEAYARLHVAVKPGPYVMLAVSDTGCGMEAETQARVFEPFFTTKEKGKGTGLGLSTVYGIIKQSGGNVLVYSEPGRGATFKIYLPRVEEAPVAGRQSGPRLASVEGQETVLLAEDEEPVRRLVRGVLEACGYVVLEAARGEEALEISKRHEGPIHLMVTDVVMPQMSGRQLAEGLAATHPEMKVLYISGYTDNAIVHHGVLDPGTAFLQKPFTPDALARKVREVLDN